MEGLPSPAAIQLARAIEAMLADLVTSLPPAPAPTAAPTPEAAVGEREAAAFLGVQVSTLQKWRSVGGGPAFVKLGRSVRYRPEDLAHFQRERLRKNTCRV